MTNRFNYPVMTAALTMAALLLAGSLQAQVITTTNRLPVVYPDGVYRTPTQVHADFNGPGLAIVLTNIEHRAFTPVTINPSGPNEFEQFNTELIGFVSANGSPFLPIDIFGPVQTEVFGRVGNPTGTFNTEMLSMDLSGTSPFGPIMIRESPTLPSVGQTTVTPVGGGQFQINSFFDVFTELSVDGGNTWIPSTGPAHVQLVPTPEPATLALAGLGLSAMLILRRRK